MVLEGSGTARELQDMFRVDSVIGKDIENEGCLDIIGLRRRLANPLVGKDVPFLIMFFDV